MKIFTDGRMEFGSRHTKKVYNINGLAENC